MKHLTAAALLALAALAGCVPSTPPGEEGANPPPPPGGPGLTEVALTALPGWSGDATANALTAFVRSCKTIALMPPDHSLGGAGLALQRAGQAGLWQNACNGARDAAPGDDQAARTFFETYFAAYQITSQALITGYFEPQYNGAKNLVPGYKVPLYAKPAVADLADLPRSAIDHGALYRKAPVTAYLADPVDAFMLQIQGSGRILLPNGRILRVGFDGQNGQPYTPIGRILVQDGALQKGNVSYQTIAAWLKAHPAQAKSIMEQNARYVYLRPLGNLADDEGAPGALGVPLTAGRSLAVDPADIPLGTPVFVDTTDPLTSSKLDVLTIAQDTGGGIHGAGAADLFFGAGPQAEATAGQMQQPGTLYILLPRPVSKS
jgi:membrane-bound lytic murein transglycosylase A